MTLKNSGSEQVELLRSDRGVADSVRYVAAPSGLVLGEGEIR